MYSNKVSRITQRHTLFVKNSPEWLTQERRGVVKHVRMRLLFEISCIKNLEFNQRRRIKTNKGGLIEINKNTWQNWTKIYHTSGLLFFKQQKLR